MGFKTIEERSAVVKAAENWPPGTNPCLWYSDTIGNDERRLADHDTKNC